MPAIDDAARVDCPPLNCLSPPPPPCAFPTRRKDVDEIQRLQRNWRPCPQSDHRAAAVGVDRGVTIYASTGKTARLSDAQQQCLRKKERASKRWERRMAGRYAVTSRRRGGTRSISTAAFDTIVITSRTCAVDSRVRRH